MWVGVAGIVLAIVGQTLAFVYWAGKLSARVEIHTQQLYHIEDKLDRHLESHSQGEAA